MMQRNVHELVAIVELAARLGVRQVAFRHLVRWEGLGMEHESLSDIKAFSNYCLDAAIRRAHELALEVQTHPEPFALGDRDRTLANVIDPTTNRAPYCPFPFFHVSMDAGGHVYPCPHAHGEPPYGRVSAETTLEAVWLGPRFGELRQRILSFDPPAMCRRCPFLADKYPNVSRLFTSRSQQ
jgi:radical SAM protein with 4Fe4S-binding SPASM domain